MKNVTLYVVAYQSKQFYGLCYDKEGENVFMTIDKQEAESYCNNFKNNVEPMLSGLVDYHVRRIEAVENANVPNQN
jgi:hypothetical protein